MKVFIDESGDLGFKNNSSKFFVITILATEDYLGIKRCVKKIRKRKLKKRIKEPPEIKANNSTKEIRIMILTDLANLRIEIHCIILKKENVYEYLKSKKEVLYNYVCGLILTDILPFISPKEIQIIIDKRSKNRFIRENFDKYVLSKLNSKNKKIVISHFESRNEEGLQAVDFISWSIFRKYEMDDTFYCSIVQNKIETERRLFQ